MAASVPCTAWENGFYKVFEPLQNFGAFLIELALAVMNNIIIISANFTQIYQSSLSKNGK